MTNKRLWILEDIIRQKSANKEFDEQYISTAENIHHTNDERCKIKRELNVLVDSEIVEEKMYSTTTPLYATEVDYAECMRAQNKFAQGAYTTSHSILERLCRKLQGAAPNSFLYRIFISYNTAATFLGLPTMYDATIDANAPYIMDYEQDKDHVGHFRKEYGLNLMRRKLYNTAGEYIRFINHVKAPGITPETMSFFKPNDTGKTLLIYMGGGIGDKIMFGRFIPRICAEQESQGNNILLLADDCLYWIFTKLCAAHSNLTVMKYSQRGTLGAFDYHTNIHMLPYWMGLEYDDIYCHPYLSTCVSDSTCTGLTRIDGKRTIIINWHGNYNNSDERMNRGITLQMLLPLFALKNIQWVSLQKEFSKEEARLLAKYNVLNLGATVDNDGHAYKDSLMIMHQADLVISTDTSFVHVAGTANIPCWVLLTLGCDWRWTKDAVTRWYPALRLFRQKEVGEWRSVIQDVVEALKEPCLSLRSEFSNC
jgi:hypothetical protein